MQRCKSLYKMVRVCSKQAQQILGKRGRSPTYFMVTPSARNEHLRPYACSLSTKE